MTNLYNLRPLKQMFTIYSEEQKLIATNLGYTPYQWASLSDEEQTDRMGAILSLHGAENIRKVVERLRSLEHSPQFIWIGLLASYQPAFYQEFQKNPPGQVPMNTLRRAMFICLLIEEKRQTIEELEKKAIDNALQTQVAMNNA